MSAPYPRHAPAAEEILVKFERGGSVLKVSLSTWEDGRTSVTISHGYRAGDERWKFINVRASEARIVAEAILRACRDQGWA